MKKFVVVSIVVAFLGLMMVCQALATPTLKLMDGIAADTVTISDNGLGDTNSALGKVFWSGTVGDYAVNVAFGITKPAAGSASNPILDLTFNVQSNTTTSQTLSLLFSETDYTAPGSGSLDTSITLLPGTILTSSAYFGANNALFDLGNQIGSTLTFTSSGHWLVSGGSAPLTPYSLTEIITVAPNADRGDVKVVSGDQITTVPEPGTLLLLGFGISGLGFIGRRNRKS